MKTWTHKEVMALDPCYDGDHVHSLFAGRERITAIDVYNMDIPTADKLWFFRQGGPQLVAATRIVEYAVRKYLLSSTIPRCVTFAEDYLAGKITDPYDVRQFRGRYVLTYRREWDVVTAAECCLRSLYHDALVRLLGPEDEDAFLELFREEIEQNEQETADAMDKLRSGE